MRVCKVNSVEKYENYTLPKLNDVNYVFVATKDNKDNAFKIFDLSLNNYNKNNISFKSKDFEQTLKDNYFHLPKDCFPDKYQVASAKALNDDKDVLVVAPTGTGKTAIAHYIMSKNMAQKKKTFYTTPLKALSNQKFREFKKIYGDENVGILTGDRRINSEAPIVLMTTEVYRNMCVGNYFGERNNIFDNLATVVFDEFHYLGDPERGPAWEESVMFNPKDIQTLCLSATIGNPEGLNQWISKLKGKPAELVSVPPEERNVPLEFKHFYTKSYASFEDEEKTTKIKNSKNDKKIKKAKDKGKQKVEKKLTNEDYANLLKLLRKKDQLPAIVFIFSRNKGAELLANLNEKDIDLTTKAEKEQIEIILNKYKEKGYLGSSLNHEALLKGMAIHNAGLLPLQKELVEELFQNKLLKLVISTETLAAGINMPARTVVISSTQKPNRRGAEKRSRLLNANEFYQMAGRAGRRGIDKQGYVYTMAINEEVESQFNDLLNSKSEPINSALTFDFAFLASISNYFIDDDILKKIIDKSFYVFDKGSDSDLKAKELLENCIAKKNFLLKRGFLDENKIGLCSTTQKGKLLSQLKGYEQIALTESIYNKDYKDFTPQMLAMAISSLACGDEYYEDPAKSDTNGANGQQKEHFYSYDHVAASLPLDIGGVYDTQYNNAKNLVSKLGLDSSALENLEQTYNSLSGAVISNDEMADLKETSDNLNREWSKIKMITTGYVKLSITQLVQKIKDGEPVSIEVIKKHAQLIEGFKQKNDFYNSSSPNSFDKLIEQKEKQLSEFDETELDSQEYKIILSEKNRLEDMKYFDENYQNILSDYIESISTTNKDELQQQAREYSKKYSEAKRINSFLKEIKTCIDINKNKDVSLAGVDGEIKAVNQYFVKLLDYKKHFDEDLSAFNINNQNYLYDERTPEFIYKWIMFNKINPESVENWKYLINITAATGDAVDEGIMLRKVMLTIDLLSQVVEVADCALEDKTDSESKVYYEQLKKNAQQAIKLLAHPPVEFGI